MSRDAHLSETGTRVEVACLILLGPGPDSRSYMAPGIMQIIVTSDLSIFRIGPTEPEQAAVHPSERGHEAEKGRCQDTIEGGHMEVSLNPHFTTIPFY